MSPKKRNGISSGQSEKNIFNQKLNNKTLFGFGKLKGDKRNIAILFFLYLLQGIPLGLMQAIPIILTNTGVSYKQQATFSLVNWPFSLKLLWAPVLECVYCQKLGRRKSWLVPTQYLIGILMLFLSRYVDSLLGNNDEEPRMDLLVLSFFCLNFLAATQDIAVDGWALTMLKRQNISYASTCNSVGQTAGYFLGYVSFLALESASFCNTYLRNEPQNHGIVTLPDFLHFWGWIFLISTTMIFLLKSERSVSFNENVSVMDSYKLLLEILKLKPVRLLTAILLTAKVGFSACDVVTGLKLIEAGIPKEKMALLAVPLVPLQVIFPIFLSRYLTEENPMKVFLTAYPYRLVCGIFFSIFVAVTPYFVVNHELPLVYCAFFLFIYCFHQVTLNSMFVAQMAFFAKISDPTIGGTYMTFLNTVANIGGTWPQALALWLVDLLTFKNCTTSSKIACSRESGREVCVNEQETCITRVDGYYVETVLCTFIGILWLQWGRKSIKKLQLYGIGSFSLRKLNLIR